MKAFECTKKSIPKVADDIVNEIYRMINLRAAHGHYFYTVDDILNGVSPEVIELIIKTLRSEGYSALKDDYVNVINVNWKRPIVDA